MIDAITHDVEVVNFALKCLVVPLIILLAGIGAALFILANQALKTWKGK